MADIIVQPKVLNADGVTYDSLIMQNAENAIKKSDGSGYLGFVQDSSSGKITTTDGYSLPKRITIFHSDEGFVVNSTSVSSASWATTPLLEGVAIGDIIEISYKIKCVSNNIYKTERFKIRKAENSDTLTASDRLFVGITNEVLPTIGQNGYIEFGCGQFRFSLTNQNLQATYNLAYRASFSQSSTTPSTQSLTIGNSEITIYDIVKII